MNSQISARTIEHPQRAVGEDERAPVQIARERADLELVHRVDLAFGRHFLRSLGPSFGLLLRNLPNFPHGDAEPEEQHRHPDTRACPPSGRSPNRSGRFPAGSRSAPRGCASPGAGRSAVRAPGRRSSPLPPPALSRAAHRASPAAHPGEASGPAGARLPPCRSSMCSGARESGMMRVRGHAGERTRRGAAPLGRGWSSQHTDAAPHHAAKAGVSKHGRIIGRRC